MVNYQGHFDDGPLKTWRTINKKINKSYIYQHITGSGKYFRRVDGSDLDLYVSVIARIRTLIQARYPCAKFDVLFWDTDADESTGILERFSAQGFLPHRVSTILPNFGDAEEGLIYKIHPQDGHPNALANERISDYVVETILPDGASCGRSGVDP
jgi:hypothetical protein